MLSFFLMNVVYTSAAVIPAIGIGMAIASSVEKKNKKGKTEEK